MGTTPKRLIFSDKDWKKENIVFYLEEVKIDENINKDNGNNIFIMFLNIEESYSFNCGKI